MNGRLAIFPRDTTCHLSCHIVFPEIRPGTLKATYFLCIHDSLGFNEN